MKSPIPDFLYRQEWNGAITMFPLDNPDLRRVPPTEVRIEQLSIEPWPGQKSVRVLLQITPFENRPDIHYEITNEQGDEVADVDIIENHEPKPAITIHIRESTIGGKYTLSVSIRYPEIGTVDQASQPFELHPEEPG